MNEIRLATVFSGIGAVEFALKRMNIPHKIVFACDNGERDDISYDREVEYSNILKLDNADKKHQYVEELYNKLTRKKNYVQQSYMANYPETPANSYYQDIMLLDGNDFKGKVDLFVGGSPCQSFSSVGHQDGLEDTRGTLFYEFARLVKEIEPKVFIYENVRNLLNHDRGKTWKVIESVFTSLGYHYKFAILNASDYGIPQTRRRLFVVGFKDEVDFTFPPKTVELKTKMKDFMEDNCAFGYMTNSKDFTVKLDKVKGKVDDKYFLSEKLYNYVMKSGTKSFVQKVEINKDIARTLLKTMGNRHRAGVDNYFSYDGSDDFGKVRMLTEREAHRLMGFTDDYKIVVSRTQAYKQAGNSIVVDVMIAILKEIMNTGIFN